MLLSETWLTSSTICVSVYLQVHISAGVVRKLGVGTEILEKVDIHKIVMAKLLYCTYILLLYLKFYKSDLWKNETHTLNACVSSKAAYHRVLVYLQHWVLNNY